jgi:hypothetical protein
MNQTKKRLSIINLAISITDIETIQLQVLQLGPLRTDEKIQEILTMLKAENYAQAQRLITTYIETPTKEILQRTHPTKESKKRQRSIEENIIIDDFNLFVEPEEDDDSKTMNLDEMLAFSDEMIEEQKRSQEQKEQREKDDFANLQIEVEPKKITNYDALLKMDEDDVLPNNIDIDISHSNSKTFWDEPVKFNLHNEDVKKDTFFDTEKLDIEKFNDKEIVKKELDNKFDIKNDEIQTTKEPIIQEIVTKDEDNETKEEPKLEKDEELNNIDNSEISQELTKRMHMEQRKEREKKLEEEIEAKTKNIKAECRLYKAIPYIDQKFKNMHVQYPPVEETMERFPAVDAWLLKIANDGYSENDIEEMIKTIESLSSENIAQAAQLLLITAATESKYAQFRLARTLYKGEILQKNLAESFTIINRLATNDDYPEAICDLAQFYEYGIGITKDKKKAELLYGEAMNLGIKRANTHYERIRKENKGLFSFFKK